MSVIINTNTIIKTKTIVNSLPPISNSLIFYVDAADQTSYPISSSKWYDLSPTKNTSSFISTISGEVIPPFDPQYGGGIQYRGYATSQNQYSAIGRVAELQPENVTVNIWFKVSGNTFNGNPVNTIFRTRLGGYIIQQRSNQTIEAIITNSSSSIPIDSGTPNLTSNVFSSPFNFNQVYNYTFSLGNNKFKTYINGTLVSEQPTFANFVLYNKDILNGDLFGDSYTAIGCDGDNIDRFFQGTVYNLQLYNRALKDAEVLNLFNSFNTLRGFNV
jgi:hypothetical protein